ncbi:MAG: SHOCT domain-containing protein [Actinomycetota bacterium]|nr:SHOCT domain-containing protein [Actinomycetota bacterium]
MGGGFVMMFSGLVFWAAIVALVAWALVRFFPGVQGAERDSAEEVLRGRFARGEIDAQEYERSLEVLRKEPDQGTYEGYVRAVREQRK